MQPIPAESEAKLFTPALTRRLVGVGLFAVLVYSAWLFYADVGEIARSIEAVDRRTVVLGLLCSTANYGVRWVRWHVYLRCLGLPVSLAESATVFTSGFAMTVTPAKMGELLKAVLLKSTHGVPIATIASVVVAERVTDLAGLVLLAALGCLAFQSGVPLALGGGLVVCVLLAVCAIRPLGEWCLGWCDKLPVVCRVADRLRAAYDALQRLSSPGVTLTATALSTVAWFSHCITLWYFAHAIAPGGIDLLESCVAYSAPLLGGTLILIPGGLGATEASMTGLLFALSEGTLSTASASAVALLARLTTFWWAVFLGLCALGLWRLRYRRATS